MAKLTQEVQAFIVQQLACFLTPSEAAAVVAEEFGGSRRRRLIEWGGPPRPALFSGGQLLPGMTGDHSSG